MFKITFNDIYLMREIMQADYGRDTCFDYIEEVGHDGNSYYATVFVEPGGQIKRCAESINAALEWWHIVFSTQPDGWDYIGAGWHLYDNPDIATISADKVWEEYEVRDSANISKEGE